MEDHVNALGSSQAASSKDPNPNREYACPVLAASHLSDDGSVMSVSGAAGAAGETDDGSGSGSGSGAFGAAAVSVGDDDSIVTPHADGSTAGVSNGGYAITLTGADDSTSTTDGGALSTLTGTSSIDAATEALMMLPPRRLMMLPPRRQHAPFAPPMALVGYLHPMGFVTQNL
jgi:hypothetical protein